MATNKKKKKLWPIKVSLDQHNMVASKITTISKERDFLNP